MLFSNNGEEALLSRIGKRSNYQFLCFSKRDKNDNFEDDEFNSSKIRQKKLLNNLP